jgi:hypothetical protein
MWLSKIQEEACGSLIFRNRLVVLYVIKEEALFLNLREPHASSLI